MAVPKADPSLLRLSSQLQTSPDSSPVRCTVSSWSSCISAFPAKEIPRSMSFLPAGQGAGEAVISKLSKRQFK